MAAAWMIPSGLISLSNPVNKAVSHKSIETNLMPGDVVE